MDGVFAKSEPELIPCGVGYSFFHDLIEPNWPENQPLHRLCSLMRKMRAQSFVREDLEPTGEIAEEAQALRSCSEFSGADISVKATRLSFFRECPGAWEEVGEKDFLGYAVVLQPFENGSPVDIRGRKLAYVQECVAAPPAVVLPDQVDGPRVEGVSNYYPHCVAEFSTTIGQEGAAKSLSIEGSFFCQQNALTHVCAHAALRMAINSSPLYPAKKAEKLTNKRINELLGIDFSQPRQVEAIRNGLTKGQIEHIVSNFGLQPTSIDFPNNQKIDYAEYIYPMIESKMPVILGLGCRAGGHVVAVLGHTANTDRWEPQARSGYGSFPLTRYHSSASWADHFIISDDNFGMYVTLPRNMVRNFIAPKFNPNVYAETAVGLVPTGIDVSGYDAESLAARAADMLLGRALHESNPCRWLDFLRGEEDTAGQHDHPYLVCRTVLVEADRYCHELFSHTDSEGNEVSAPMRNFVRQQLPERVWVSELSLLDLYSANKTKLGDVLVKADADREAHQSGKSLVFAWLPGVAWFGELLGRQIRDWPLTGHIPFLRHNDGPLPALEW